MMKCTIFSVVLFPNMDDFAMTYGHFMNAQEMLKYSEKHPVSRANNGNTKKVVIARWLTK